MCKIIFFVILFCVVFTVYACLVVFGKMKVSQKVSKKLAPQMA